LIGLISKGEVKEDGIRSIIIITGEEDLLHLGEGNFQMDSLSPLPPRSLKVKFIFFDPQPALPSRSFNRKPSVIVSMARVRNHHDEI
jgi:hypothetical protein